MRFRLHLSTWILLFLAASLLVGAHTWPLTTEARDGDTFWRVQQYGFPIPYLEIESAYSNPTRNEHGTWLWIPFNFVLTLSLLAFVLEPKQWSLRPYWSMRNIFSYMAALGVFFALYDNSIHSTKVTLRAYSEETQIRKGWPYCELAWIKEDHPLDVYFSSGLKQHVPREYIAYNRLGEVEDPEPTLEFTPNWKVRGVNMLVIVVYSLGSFVLSFNILSFIQREASSQSVIKTEPKKHIARDALIVTKPGLDLDNIYTVLNAEEGPYWPYFSNEGATLHIPAYEGSQEFSLSFTEIRSWNKTLKDETTEQLKQFSEERYASLIDYNERGLFLSVLTELLKTQDFLISIDGENFLPVSEYLKTAQDTPEPPAFVDDRIT